MSEVLVDVNQAFSSIGSPPSGAAAALDQHSDPTLAELASCVELLERLLADPDALARVPESLRRALLIAAGKLSRPLRHERERVTKAMRRYRRKLEQQADLELRQTTQIRDARSPKADDTAPQMRGSVTDRSPPRTRDLNQPQSCYICKRDYTELHRFYDAMCPDCAEFNYRKRSQTANLAGKVALVTGARIKIGFHTVLMLLRAGATVIGTTRFAHDAAARFAREPDFDIWSNRLTLYGLDLRFCPAVERFAAHLLERLPRLDVLINNAAQTVHRPSGFFAHLRDVESLGLDALPERERSLLLENHRLEESNRLLSGDKQGAAAARSELTAVFDMPQNVDAARVGLALPTLLGSDPAQHLEDAVHFPRGRFDPDGQQLDLRQNNSWRLKAADVSTPELIEVHLVNAIAPFILVSRLKQLMCRTPGNDKHIVNVSAMEGVFARRTKTDKHPHTNMAKASLNMLTRTSAKDYVHDGIHMNSVDTGWVTDEDPHPHSERKRRDYDFSPPLDAIDGAARVCDPIFAGCLSGEHPWGQFFKDYRAAEW